MDGGKEGECGASLRHANGPNAMSNCPETPYNNIVYLLYNIYLCIMTNTGSSKIQTAFRLDNQLVNRLKRKARMQGVSLNSLVENELNRLAPPEPEFPIIDGAIELTEEVIALGSYIKEIPERAVLLNDERAQYILNK